MELILCNRTIYVLIFVKNIIQALVLFEGRHLLVNLLYELAGIWAGGYACYVVSPKGPKLGFH